MIIKTEKAACEIMLKKNTLKLFATLIFLIACTAQTQAVSLRVDEVINTIHRSRENTKSIEGNKRNISYNKSNIDQNRNDIDLNKEYISGNKKSIENLSIKNGQNTGEINNNKLIIIKHNSLIERTELKSESNTRLINGISKDFSDLRDSANHNFYKLNKEIKQNHKKAMAGISAAMAMNSIPWIERKDVSMGMGGGTYGSETATAFGMHYKIEDIARVSTFMSYDSDKNMGVAAGVSIGW